MKAFLRFLAGFLLVSVVIRVVGEVAKSSITELDDPDGDEFDLIAITDGKEFASTAPALRRGRVRVIFGGMDLDLRQAGLAPDGADLEVLVAAGGLRILVDPAWRVEVTSSGIAGGVAVDSQPEPRADAPELRISLGCYAGGVQVAAEPSRTHVVHQHDDPA